MNDIEHRERDHRFVVNVPVVVPEDTWAHICRQEWLDPLNTDPEDVRDRVDEYIEFEFSYSLAFERGSGEPLNTSEEIRYEGRDEVVATLPPHQRVVYEIVKEHGEIRPRELYEEYRERVDNSKTKRTVRNYLRKMTQYDLIVAKGTSRDRTYQVSSKTPVRED